MLKSTLHKKYIIRHDCKLFFKLTHRLTNVLAAFIIITLTQQCSQPRQQQHHRAAFISLVEAQRFVDSSTLKPSIILISPQTFKVPTNPLQNDPDEQTRLQQYVALINNAQNDREDQLLRQQFNKLTLQVRDARSPITGQLFYEHTFDYFPLNQQHLLIPIKLDQVSSVQEYQTPRKLGHRPSSWSSAYAKVLLGEDVKQQRPQQLIISVRPHHLESAGFGSESIELVSSAPILVEPVPSKDGRRSFSIVQTDKPIYKPDEKVRIRCLVVNEILRPIVRDELKLQIRNPHNIVVEEMRFPRPPNETIPPTLTSTTHQTQLPEPLYLDHVFEFPPEPMLGSWSVHLLHNDPVANDSTSFVVKEYVLPPFEVQFFNPQYVLPSTVNISGHIVAKYHYGKPVQGTAHFKFGYIPQRDSATPAKVRYVARSNVKKIDPTDGRVDYKIAADKFREFEKYPDIAGSPFVVEVIITEMSTGHTETQQDSSCLFLKTPYRIVFDDSIEDFKPGLSQQLTVQLVEQQSLRPGPAGQRIVARYVDQNNTQLGTTSPTTNKQVDVRERLDAEAITDSAGRATFNIGPVREDVTSIYVEMRLYNSSSHIKRHTNEMNSNSINNNNVKTNLDELAFGHHTLMKHESQNGWVSLMNKSVTHLNVGDWFVSDLLIRDAVVIPQKIFFLIIARGQILALDTLNQDGLVRFQVGETMMPSIRLVLFALTHDSIGMLSDSMRINVGHDLNCGLHMSYKPDGSNGLTLNENGDVSVRPNDRGRLVMNARQGDLISLIGVDSAVYTLFNRTRLSSDRIIERVKRLDAGCGFGGGRNNLDVFHNAGLMLFKDVASSGPVEAPHKFVGSSCLMPRNHWKYLEEAKLGYTKPWVHYLNQRSKSIGLSRSKREVDVGGILKRYKDPFHKACCRLGTYADFPQGRNCSVRAKIVEKYMAHIEEYKSCASIYLDCCRAVFGEHLLLGAMGFAGRTAEDPITSRRIVTESAQAPQYMDSSLILPNTGQLNRIESETLVRNDFRETWLFDLVQVTSETGMAHHNVQLPHSITSWTVSALALNQFRPMCVMAKPLELVTFQPIFLQLSMPFKVVQGEQIDLITSVYNYSPQTQEVLVYMYGVEDVCSEAEPGERSERRRLRIERHQSHSVLFSMIPLKVGKHPIKVVAVALNSNHSDIVERKLNVVPRGKTVTDETTFSLDPMNHQKRSKRAIQTGNLVDEIDSSKGVQRSKVRLAPTRDSEFIVPQTQECIVSAIGDKLGQSVQTTLLDVENLIRLPHGCGEQVMIYLGPTLYTTRYLSSMNKLTGHTRWKAIRYIQSGYKRILNFREEGGGFSAFAKREPSIWLTAFVAKMLCQTERTPFVADQIHVDKTVISSALKWLIQRQDNNTHTWIEVNPVYHQEMLGGVLKENALTAFVTLSLNECAHHSTELVEETTLANSNYPAGEQGNDEPPSSSYADGHLHQSNGVDKLRVAIQRAEAALLRDHYKAVKEKNPYVLALASYALSFSRPQEAASMLNDLMLFAERSQSRNQLYWRGDYQIETAAYALQALIELAPILTSSAGDDNEAGQSTGEPTRTHLNSWRPGADAVSIANWLSSKRSYTGAFESTQDTVVALEALSKFAQLQPSPNGNALIPQSSAGSTSSLPSLMCNVTINNRTRRSIEFGKDNAQVLQTFKLDSYDLDNSMNGEMLDIMTSGDGLGTMSVKLKYNVFQEEDDLCRFNIDSSIEEWTPPDITLPNNNNNNKIRGTQADKDHDLPELNYDHNAAASNETTEDDYFQSFDKSMLDELNLITFNQMDPSRVDLSGKIGQAAMGKRSSRDVHTRPAPTLRLKRSSAANKTSPLVVDEHHQEGWASRVVSSLKSKLPSWLVPVGNTGGGGGGKSSNTSTGPDSSTRRPFPVHISTTRMSLSRSGLSLSTSGGPPDVAKPRAATSRRSATQSPASVLISTPTGIPAGSHLNDLSGQIEFTPSKGWNSTASGSGYNNTTSIVAATNSRLVLLLRVCVHHMSSRRDSEMAVIEIGILSGFKPNEADLKMIVGEVSTPAMKYELSADRSLVVFYMHHIPFSGPYCMQFRVVRDSLVYNLQSGYIRAYEYYSPTHACSSFYTPSRQIDAIQTKCDPSGQVCQCAAKSLCPVTKKLQELSEVYQVNTTSARAQLSDLVCSERFDLVSLVRLKHVRYFETGRMYKLTVKIKSDLRGNLTKIIEAQRDQKGQFVNAVRKPRPDIVTSMEDDEQHHNDHLGGQEDSPLEHLTLTIDADCVRNDQLLLHLAHPSQWKQGGELMILFARSDKLERRHLRVAAKSTSNSVRPAPLVGPKPKPAILSSSIQQMVDQQQQQQHPRPLTFDDAQQIQYSLSLPLDKSTILHDVTYQAKSSSREAINNLILWLELRSRREKWTCRPIV